MCVLAHSHSQKCIWDGFTEKATFYAHVKECIAVCEIELGKERKCVSHMQRCWGMNEHGIVNNWWEIWYISLTTFYVIYYSKKNVFPILFHHVIPSSNAVFGNPICKQIISDNLRNRCFGWLESTDNSLPPSTPSGDLWWDAEKSLEIITPAQFEVHCPRLSGPILFVCRFLPSLHVCHL